MRDNQSLYDLLKDQERDEDSYNTTGISLEKWKELGENGVSIPMRIPLHGSSMSPLIRSEKDIVTIMPLVRDPMIGDIVLLNGGNGKTIAHRVYKVFPDGIQTWGDNCRNADPPRKRKDIYGLIVSMDRDGKIHQLDTDKQRAYGIIWMKYGRKAWMALKMIRAVGRKIANVKNWSF